MHLCVMQRPGNSSMAHQEALLSSSLAKINALLTDVKTHNTGSFIFRALWIFVRTPKFAYQEEISVFLGNKSTNFMILI